MFSNKFLNSQCPTFISINSNQYKIVGLVEILTVTDIIAIITELIVFQTTNGK